MSKRKRISLRELEKFRQKLVSKDEFKLKPEFVPEEEEDAKDLPRGNQVIDIAYFKDLVTGKFYLEREQKHDERIELKPMHVRVEAEVFNEMMKPQMSMVVENSQESNSNYPDNECEISSASEDPS